MSDADNDPMLRRAIDELRQLPPVDHEAVRRVVSAAAAARLSSPADESVFVGAPARPRFIRVWSAIGIAAAAAIVGFVVRGQWPAAKYDTTVATPASAAGQQIPVRSAATSESESRPIPQQFVFDNSIAHRVAVVGDFNNWNPANGAMVRSSDGTTWSVIIPIYPGRHIYGYMVDSVFTLDPRSPKARDADLGTEGSVVIVGRP